MMLGASRKYL